ncbi:MAG: hypothetical protein DSO07_07360 [Thermoproteota archaeon]|jgi:hypothetical protein|uniref:DUF262 domain-containing protein n=1 Tax=Candidatus Methanodesulfokora washburnensis TaxID=2478471 RepID=A0A429GN23_9CREN|nr:DUF262 domain-containing protein [Candidatus Methanodesulfokores washburnensis]TDA40900.1 MAG: hypothetical protein DSO07_07360 [Candidatus Korarchaeota archaeon]
MAIHEPEPNIIKIYRLVEEVVSGELDIPEFQREFVWTKDQVKDLLDSLIKGYPIGSLLIWDLSDYKSGKHTFDEKRKDWIVDGQQRIVSLCLIMSKKPYWMDNTEWNELLSKYKIKINVLSLEVALEYPGIKKDPAWINPREIFSEEKDEGLSKLAEEISRKMNKSEEFTKIYSNIKRVWDIQNIGIPVIKVKAKLEDIATIFERINSAGTRVKQSDVTLAYIAVYNKDKKWIREKFMRYLDDLEDNGFYFDPTLIIRAITTIGENKAVLKNVSDEFLRNEKGVLDKAFSGFKRSMRELIQDLRNVGVLNSELIYAKNTIIPLIYLYHKFPDQHDFNKAFHFFLLALKRGRYSGSAETSLQEDVNIIHKADSFEKAIEELHSDIDPREIEAELSKDAVRNSVHYQGEGRFLKLLLYLVVYKKEAKDWFSKKRLGYLEPDEINRDFTIEVHHFFPKNILREKGYRKDEQEALANIAFINPGTNKRLRDEPYIYIKKYKISEEELSKQLIPIDERLWEVDHYREFLDRRSEIIADELTRYMRSLYPEFYS